MSWLKKIVRKVENQVRRTIGKGNIVDTRSDAADQLLKKEVPVTRQAGQGQIKYTGETYV